MHGSTSPSVQVWMSCNARRRMCSNFDSAPIQFNTTYQQLFQPALETGFALSFCKQFVTIVTIKTKYAQQYQWIRAVGMQRQRSTALQVIYLLMSHIMQFPLQIVATFYSTSCMLVICWACFSIASSFVHGQSACMQYTLVDPELSMQRSRINRWLFMKVISRKLMKTRQAKLHITGKFNSGVLQVTTVL